ncbi:hypothetical protein L1049_010891 [Liquidambar formosana]|uniref:Uncharacterized protein n=1 Tax=Liquidambar formosana TaxID=63359 RepID=A0AAP0WZC6_LIQFO
MGELLVADGSSICFREVSPTAERSGERRNADGRAKGIERNIGGEEREWASEFWLLGVEWVTRKPDLDVPSSPRKEDNTDCRRRRGERERRRADPRSERRESGRGRREWRLTANLPSGFGGLTAGNNGEEKELAGGGKLHHSLRDGGDSTIFVGEEEREERERERERSQKSKPDLKNGSPVFGFGCVFAREKRCRFPT